MNNDEDKQKDSTEQVSLNEEALSNLVHQLTHDVGNPITSVITYSSLVQQAGDLGLSGEKLESYGHSIAAEAWKANTLLEKFLLLVSRKDTGTKTNLRDCLAKVMQRYGSRYGLSEFDVVVDDNTTSDELYVHAEMEQLASIISEMISNAAQAIRYIQQSEDTEIDNTISIELTQKDDTTTLSVRNPSAAHSLSLADLLQPMTCENYPSKKGLGIGLPAINNTLSRWGGSLDINYTSQNDTHGEFVCSINLQRFKD